MIATAAKRRSEAQMKKQLSTRRWIDDLPFLQALERLESQPTVNIEGLVGGYKEPGGKTVFPHKASAKLDWIRYCFHAMPVPTPVLFSPGHRCIWQPEILASAMAAARMRRMNIS